SYADNATDGVLSASTLNRDFKTRVRKFPVPLSHKVFNGLGFCWFRRKDRAGALRLAPINAVNAETGLGLLPLFGEEFRVLFRGIHLEHYSAAVQRLERPQVLEADVG